MRLPRPAAGTTPHISNLLECGLQYASRHRPFEELHKFPRPLCRTVLLEHAFAGTSCNAPQFAVVALKRREHVLFFISEQDLRAGFEEVLNPFPCVAQERSTAGSGLEQAARRTPTRFHHRAAGYVQRQAGRSEEGGVLGGRQMTDEINIA